MLIACEAFRVIAVICLDQFNFLSRKMLRYKRSLWTAILNPFRYINIVYSNLSLLRENITFCDFSGEMKRPRP